MIHRYSNYNELAENLDREKTFYVTVIKNAYNLFWFCYYVEILLRWLLCLHNLICFSIT